MKALDKKDWGGIHFGYVDEAAGASGPRTRVFGKGGKKRKQKCDGVWKLRSKGS